MTAEAATHGHLWVLDDGTPVHAPPGRLTRNDVGQLCCHLCGRWFDHLGAHLRRHGWTAAQYRTAVGLATGRALCNTELSRTIGRRQRIVWHTDGEVRAAFAAGRQAGVDALTAPGRDRRPAVEVVAVNTENLRRTRVRRDDERTVSLTATATAAGHHTLAQFLRDRYEHGASLADLQRETGWSRPRVRDILEAAGATIRPTGQTTAAGRARRTDALRARVTSRIGTEDVEGWLAHQRAAGASVADLARRTGRSDTWVRSQLRRPTAQPPRRVG